MKRTSLLSHGTILYALLFASLPAFAQTFFGSGGVTNSATDASNVGLGGSVLYINTTGSWNTATGNHALASNTEGSNNTAVGAYGLASNTTGTGNSALGFYALFANTTGFHNTGAGYQVLFSNTTGIQNTAIGYYALNTNTTGSFNSASGYQALYANTAGNNNLANGFQSLFYNTTGYNNAANGFQALYTNATGNNNTASGAYTLFSNTAGGGNSANGYYALYRNTTGSYNTANGYQSLFKNASGSYNTAQGYNSLYNASRGRFNIGIGYAAGYNITTGSNNIAIGNLAATLDNGMIRIGTTGTHTATFIAGINGSTASSGVAVYVDSNGQLGTITSSRRFKNDIKTMGTVSDKLLQLRPVTFRYKVADEKGGHPMQYGLIAEEVAKVFPDLVQYDKAGKPFTVRYHLLTPMILNELQKSRREIVEVKSSQNAKISRLEAELAAMKQAQAKQQELLARLAAYIQNGKKSATTEKANFVQH